LDQAEKDLATAKAAQPPSSSTAATATNEVTGSESQALADLQAKFDLLQSEKENWDTVRQGSSQKWHC